MPNFYRNRQAINALAQNPTQLSSNTFYSGYNMSTGAGWDDNDSGSGSSTLTTYDGWDCFCYNAGSGGADSDYASGNRDDGTFTDEFTCSIILNCVDVGSIANNDFFEFSVGTSTRGIVAGFTNTNLYFAQTSGGTFTNTGVTVEANTWTNFTFQHTDLTPNTILIWKNGILITAITQTANATDGLIQSKQNGETTANQITYVRNIKVGNGIIYG